MLPTTGQDDLINQLAHFIQRSREKTTGSREWLVTEQMRVYVRKATHMLGKRMGITLDIAAVEVEEEYQRKGYWSQFIRKAHKMNPWDATYMECVHSDILLHWCHRHGWERVNEESFYLLKKEPSLIRKRNYSLF